MTTLFDTIPQDNITIRLIGAIVEVIFDTKVDPSFERQFKRLISANVRGVDGITMTNRYDENTRFKISITAYGLTRLADMQQEIRSIAYSHAQFVESIPVQSSLF